MNTTVEKGKRSFSNANVRESLLQALDEPSTRKHVNRLPINLFHSPAEYHKLIATNGRNVVSKNIFVDGTISTLEYLNHNIFELNAKKNQRIKAAVCNKGQLVTINNNCCCCDQYCYLCASQSSTIEKNIQPLKHLNEVPQKKTLRERTKRNHYKTSLQIRNKFPFDLSANPYKYSPIKPEQLLSSLIQRNSQDKKKQKKIIYSAPRPHFLFRSQKQFNTKDNRLLKVNKNKQVEKIKLKQFNEKIKKKNKQNSLKARPKSSSPHKPTAAQVRFQYWEMIKDKVAQQVIASRHLQLNKAKQECASKPKHYSMGSQYYINLRKKHQLEAYNTINKIKKATADAKNKIVYNLRKLQEQKMRHIFQCKSLAFKPTRIMEEKAFTDFQLPQRQQPELIFEKEKQIEKQTEYKLQPKRNKVTQMENKKKRLIFSSKGMKEKYK